MTGRTYYRGRTDSAENTVNYIIEMLVVFCLMCRLGFPGNLAQVFGGEKIEQAIDYGSSFLQILLIVLCSGRTVLDLKLIDLKRKYLPIYLMLLLMFVTSLLVSGNRAKQTTIIVRFSITAFFGLWLSDNYEPEHMLDMIYLAQIGILIANLLTLFVFRGAGYHYDEGYGYTFRGLYPQKNGLGSAFAYGVVFQVTHLRLRRSRGERVSTFFWLVLGAQIFLLIISKATTAIFCCVVPIIYQILFDRRNGRVLRFQWGILYTVITVGFLFFAMTTLPLFAPMLEAIGKDATLSNRVPMWEKIIQFLVDHNTFTGYGLLQFWETPSALKTLQVYFQRNSWYRSMAFGAHSTLLEIWLDLGLIGLASYFVTIMYCFQDVKRLKREEYIFVSMILIPILISGLTDRIYTNANAKTLFFFAMLGMACRGGERRRAEKRERMRRREAVPPGSPEKEVPDGKPTVRLHEIKEAEVSQEP